VTYLITENNALAEEVNELAAAREDFDRSGFIREITDDRS
jgi:hypothetical protein